MNNDYNNHFIIITIINYNKYFNIDIDHNNHISKKSVENIFKYSTIFIVKQFCDNSNSFLFPLVWKDDYIPSKVIQFIQRTIITGRSGI